jgi:hypothetical protein
MLRHLLTIYVDLAASAFRAASTLHALQSPSSKGRGNRRCWPLDVEVERLSFPVRILPPRLIRFEQRTERTSVLSS